MPNKLKINLAISASILSLCALLLFIVLGPFISLYGIQSNLDGGESENLHRYIDFPVLQENLKVKIRAQAQNTLGFDFSESENVLAKFAMKFANQIIDVAVENAVSPKGIAMMLSGNDLSEIMSGEEENTKKGMKKTEAPKKDKKTLIEMFQKSHFEYVDTQNFIFYLPNKEGSLDKSGSLKFSRIGIVWKLNDIEFAQ